MDILQFRGQTGRYLEPAPGAASWNLMKMAREGLALDLRAAIHKARKGKMPVRSEGLNVRFEGQQVPLCVEVMPLQTNVGEEEYYLVLFEEAVIPRPEKKAARAVSEAGEKGLSKEVKQLTAELSQTKQTLQHIIEEHETTNEELRAANEEIQSANEELQSTNEELETAKEELQSTNEELTTLNAELESQNLELSQAINDFNNLHNSVNIPVVLLGTDLRIRSFTPPAERALRLIPADSGRPIDELKLGIEVQNLEQKVIEVIETLNTKEEEVRAHDGRWYLMRIRPYRTTDNKITGAVIALIDNHERKVVEEDLRAAKELAGWLLSTASQPVVAVDAEMRVHSANPAFYREFSLTPGQAEGRSLLEMGDGQWDALRLRALLEEVVTTKGSAEGFEIEHTSPGTGRHTLFVSARRIGHGSGDGHLTFLAFQMHGS
jgi:two-component system CheB/CheR fusion protein